MALTYSSYASNVPHSKLQLSCQSDSRKASLSIKLFEAHNSDDDSSSLNRLQNVVLKINKKTIHFNSQKNSLILGSKILSFDNEVLGRHVQFKESITREALPVYNLYLLDRGDNNYNHANALLEYSNQSHEPGAPGSLSVSLTCAAVSEEQF